MLAVGGTSLSLSGSNYGSETGWSGSGGGVSQYESQPSYQQGLMIHNGGSTVNPAGMRTIPDVAFDADPSTGVALYDSYNGGSAPWMQTAGTSLAAPCWAGLIALADQMRVSAGLTTLDGPSQTLPRLYQLPAADFHDITSGTTTGSPNYTAAAGYDLVTGLGTPVANLLVPALAGVVTLGPASLPADTVNVPYYQTISTSGGTGNITLTVSNLQNPIAGLALPAGGSNAFSITGTPTAAGTETFTVTVTDTWADTTSANYSITVNAAVALGPSTLPADMVNVAYNQTLTASGGTGSIAVTVSNVQNPIAGLILPASGSNALCVSGMPTAAGTETFTVTATDTLGAATSTNYSITVDMNPPVLAGIESAALAYTEGNPAAAVTSSLAVSDAESATLAGATVWISGNYQSGADTLSFVNTTNFTGSWDAATGVLTLSGSDTLANYQAALRTVAYVNNRLNPSTATRTVSFKVNDGLADSNVLARDIAMQLLNPAVDDVVLGGPAASSLVNDYPANTIFSQFTFNGNCALSGNAAQLDSTMVNAQ